MDDGNAAGVGKAVPQISEYRYRQKERGNKVMDKGSYVVMNGKYRIPPDMVGRVWRVARSPFAVNGVPAVVLEGHGGCYPVDGLREVPENFTRIIISGSRCANDYSVLLRTMVSVASNIGKESMEIISGDCYGADGLGNLFAERNGIWLTKMPAAWDSGNGSVNRAAGPMRNAQMAKYASLAPRKMLVCLWDRSSRGTYNMIQNGFKYGLDTYVVDCVTGASILQYTKEDGGHAYLYDKTIQVDGKQFDETILSTGAWLSIVGKDNVLENMSPFKDEGQGT